MQQFNVAEGALAWPQSCIRCGDRRGRLFDGHRDIRLPGQAGGQGFMHVYWCEGCIEEAAGVAGIDKREELVAVQTELEQTVTLLGQATARIDELEDANSLSGRLSALEKLVAVAPGQEPADIE